MIGKLTKAIHILKNKIALSFKEKRLGKLKYLYEQNGSDELIILFSGFGSNVRKYNYMKTLKDAKIDKLFILDVWGYRGSYYWYEKGKDEPKRSVSKLIESIWGGYKHVYAAGSSKGGTCAIYYGLKYDVDAVFASACQYHVGNYLNTEKHKKILQGMMGKHFTDDDVQKLNDELPDMIRMKSHSSTIVNLYYSKKDNTYEKHIIDLKNDLSAAGIRYTTTEDDYVNHSENGIFFKKHLKRRFCQ